MTGTAGVSLPQKRIHSNRNESFNCDNVSFNESGRDTRGPSNKPAAKQEMVGTLMPFHLD